MILIMLCLSIWLNIVLLRKIYDPDRKRSKKLKAKAKEFIEELDE